MKTFIWKHALSLGVKMGIEPRDHINRVSFYQSLLCGIFFICLAIAGFVFGNLQWLERAGFKFMDLNTESTAFAMFLAVSVIWTLLVDMFIIIQVSGFLYGIIMRPLNAPIITSDQQGITK